MFGQTLGGYVHVAADIGCPGATVQPPIRSVRTPTALVAASMETTMPRTRPVKPKTTGTTPARRAVVGPAVKAPDHHAGHSGFDSLTEASITQLQEAVGNQTVARLIATPHTRHGHTHARTEGAASRPGGRVGPISSAPGHHVHRHASWEHKMLGDVDPATLEIIASGRDVATEQGKKDSVWKKTRNSAQTIRNDKGEEINLETVLHTVDQEIRRLRYFKTSPPTGTVAEATEKLRQQDRDDRLQEVLDVTSSPHKIDEAKQKILASQWDVRLLSIALKDGTSFIVTYGEMNTLADFYGSRKELEQTPADNFKGIVGGVREESLRKFMRLRNELTISGKKPYDPDSSDHSFAGAIGNKGESAPTGLGAFISGDQYGELKLMGEMGGGREARAIIPGKEETSYMAGLARNACHFAPYSWHAWGTAHTKAETLAKRAGTLRANAAKLRQQNVSLESNMQDSSGRKAAIQYNRELAEQYEAEAETLQNEALIENGFGDHFLQDSYAAGHLIDKTLIMQWFAKWLDTKGRKRDYSTEEQWRRIQQIAYGQKGVSGNDLYDKSTIGQETSNDPQTVENTEGTWEDRFEAAGLEIPSTLRNPNSPAFRLFTWWQGEAMDGRFLKADSNDLIANGPIQGKPAVKAALRTLIKDGLVYYDWYSTKDRAKGPEKIGIGTKNLRLKAEYIPKDKVKFRAAMFALNNGDATAYQKRAKAVTYGDYHNFINHGYLQLSSNVLHDHFCANGLDVATQQGDTPYKIYGDNAMLGKESATMVKYSATTSHMSRDSIYELAQTGATAISTSSIAARFPTYVRPVGLNANLSLEQWHGEGGALHKLCVDKIFPDAAALFSKSTVAAKAKLATQVSKDSIPQIHSGEAF